MPSRVSSIYWGSLFQNTLNLGYPLSHVLTDREPRPGAQFTQSVTGVEDAWWPGADYTMEAEARFLPALPNFDGAAAPNPLQSAVSSPAGVEAFLDYARAKNPFRFVPDITTPLFWIDGCYLADPMKGGRSISARLDFNQKIKLRNPTTDFAAALRGLMFEYTPGLDISPYGLNGTFSRAGAAGRFLDNGGLAANALANVLRDRHYPLGFGTGGLILPRTSLVEGAATNSCIQSQALATSWSNNQATAANNAGVAPDGTNTATSIIPAAGTRPTANPYCQSTGVTITANEQLAGSIFVKQKGTYNGLVIYAFEDAPSANGAFVQINLTTGAIIASSATGTGTLTGVKVVPLANGWFWVGLWGQISTASPGQTTAYILTALYPDTTFSGTAVYDGVQGYYAWGAQLERNGSNKRPPTSYIATTTGVASRSTDNLTFPWPYKPQAQWFYVKFTELGTLQTGINARGGWFQLGTSGDRSIFFVMELGAPQFSLYHRGSIDRSVNVNVSAVVHGDTCEALGVLFADGSVDLWFSRNGAADVHAGASASFPGGLAAAWSNNLLGLGMWSGVVDLGVTGIQSFKVGTGSNVNSLALARAA